MSQPYIPAENILIIHRTMVDEELQRQHPERHHRLRDTDRPGPLAAARRFAARGLLALGTRLDPSVSMPESGTAVLQRA